jgi:hypothetical protein
VWQVEIQNPTAEQATPTLALEAAIEAGHSSLCLHLLFLFITLEPRVEWYDNL